MTKYRAKRVFLCPQCNHGHPKREGKCCGSDPKTWIKFDSQGEYNRYWELRQLEKAGEIFGLELQPEYPITVRNLVGDSETVGKYIADFTYYDHTRTIVEDFKGMDTPLSKFKRKLVKAIYGIDVLVTGNGRRVR